MKKVFLFLSLLALLACDQSDLTRNDGLIGKWRMAESINDPGDGSGQWQRVKSREAEIIEFRYDSTFRLVKASPATGFFGGSIAAVKSRFTVRGKKLYLYDTQPEIEPSNGIGFEADSEELILGFPCIEPCVGKYIPID